jgi:uncharacterized damage-inducible protein DinB
MTASQTKEHALSTLLIARWEEIHRKIANLAREIPEKKLESRTATDIRTFGEVLRHLAFWNRYVADVLSGNPADDSANEVPFAEYPTRAKMIQIMEQHAQSVVAAWKALPSPAEPKSVELIISFTEHACEHYGQLAVYARLAGIVPPVSRSQA